MKIIVIGGGIGGLSLASGLKKNGFDVVVVEKDSALSVTGGYHITLRKDVQEALGRLLPKNEFDKILASAADGKKRDPDVFWDWRGRQFYKMKPLIDPGIDIDRITLRVLLGGACAGTVLLSRRCIGYETSENKVVAILDDGRRIAGDLLVACDGAHSTIVKQLSGAAANRTTGIVGISGRTPISRLSPELAKKLGHRSSMAMGPGGVALYLGYFDPVNMSVINRPDIRASITKEPVFIWGAMFPETKKIMELKDSKGYELQNSTIELFRKNGWAESLLEVIDKSETDDIALYQFNAASANPQDLAPWNVPKIMALGDAVHATPPTAGMGAGIAIQDADDLVNALMMVRNEEKSMETAFTDFRDRMRERGSKAIISALGIIKWINFTNTAVGKVITKITLPVMAKLLKD